MYTEFQSTITTYIPQPSYDQTNKNNNMTFHKDHVEPKESILIK